MPFYTAILTVALLAGTPTETYLTCLLDFERYAEAVWHDAGSPANSGYFGDGASGGNGGIRGTCGIGLAYAVLVTEQPDSPERERRLSRIKASLTYASSTHLTGDATCVDGKPWGRSWQSCLWTGSLALTAALVEQDLSPELVQACRRVLADEADRLSEIPPPSGYVGDSKAEENAWNSNVPALAASWLRDDPRAAKWLETAKRYLVNTYAVANHGDDPLAEWITTTTLYPSFICENHGFFHPSYQMVSGMSLGDSLLMSTLTSPETAKELAPFAEHNVLPVWQCLSQVLLDSGELAYPSGLDWALHGYGQISYYPWLATHFNDPTARWAEPKLAALLRQRQQVSGDGRFTGESVSNGFYREAVMARRAAIALLHHRAAKYPTGPSTPPRPFVSHLPDAKLVLQRSADGLIAVSYGPRIMATVFPAATPDQPYLVTPRQPSLLPRATRAEAREVEVTDRGFEVLLRLSQAGLPAAEVKLVSTGEVLAVIEAPGLLSDRESFPLGIENHKLTGGSRTVTTADGAQTIRERGGQSLQTTDGWLAVDTRLGYVVGPAGTLRYRAAQGYNRRGAAEDYLDYLPAEPPAPRFCLVAPGLDAEATRRLQSSVRYAVTATAATLRFDTASGPQTVTLPLSPDLKAPGVLLQATGVKPSSERPDYPATNCLDGDFTTFWVSDRDGAEPGHGPTAEHPERLEFTLDGKSNLGRILIFPRPNYGPKQLRVRVDGQVVFEGAMKNGPLEVKLEQPAKAMSVSLELLSSHDPRFPTNSRNVQIMEVLFLAP